MKPQQIRSTPLTPGKVRGLDVISTDAGFMTCLAIDHSENYVELLDHDWQHVPAEKVTASKLGLVKDLSAGASAVLLDPIWSAAQAICGEVIPRGTGLVVAVDELIYQPGNGYVIRNRVRPGWGVEKAKRMGADAVKMALWWRPDSPIADETIALAEGLVADCRRYDIALIVEPLWYPLEDEDPADPATMAGRTESIIESAKVFTKLGIDTLKIGFPSTPGADAGQARDAVQGIAENCAGIPWVLLSGGGDFEHFRREVQIVCEAGASGFMAGRAVWGDAVGGSAAEHATRIERARERLAILDDIVNSCARPWRVAASVSYEHGIPADDWRYTY